MTAEAEELTEEQLDDMADELDLVLLQRAKLALLVSRLRAVHKRLTRTNRYRPRIRTGDTHLEDGPYVPPREPWRDGPRRRRDKRPPEDNPKGLWRKAKLPW